MAKIGLNKSELHRERERLRLYQRVLPSLDLKRRQLLMSLSQAKGFLERAHRHVEDLRTQTAKQLPMMANQDIEISGLVRVQSIQIHEENIIGVKLPVLMGVNCSVREYSWLAKPHWVDVMVDRLKDMAELHARVQVASERVRRFDRAVRRTTQRVNLFEKILIPEAKNNIKLIQIFLGDAERAAVVRSKIFKARFRQEQVVLSPEGSV